MNVMTKTLFDLQEQQLEHDMKCHRDIFFLSHQDRFKHIALHYGKYSKRLADLVLNPRNSSKAEEIVTKTLVDTMIMILNSGELLQINFEHEICSKLGLVEHLFIKKLPELLRQNDPDLYKFLSEGDTQQLIINLMLEMVSISGFMQKSAEELDHLMGMPRQQIKHQTFEFLCLIIVAGSIWNVDFQSELEKRWAEIEQKVIL